MAGGAIDGCGSVAWRERRLRGSGFADRASVHARLPALPAPACAPAGYPSGASAAERSDCGSSGGTSRYWSANRAMSRNAGAATEPPKIAP